MRSLFVLLLVVLLAGPACGGPSSSGGGPGGAAQEYEATGTVLEDRSHGPELCLGVILTSDPIQCGGLPLVGWDWDAVDGEEVKRGIRTVGAHVRGTFDGTRFTLTAPPGPPRRPSSTPREPDVSPACDDPTGDRSVGDAAWGETGVSSHQGVVAIWVSDPAGPWDGPFVGSFVVRPGAAAEVTALVRQTYRGLLCVVERDLPTMHELDRIQERLPAVVGQVVWTASPDYRRGVVEAMVTVADERTRRAVDEAFGPGRVELTGALTPVAR